MQRQPNATPSALGPRGTRSDTLWHGLLVGLLPLLLVAGVVALVLVLEVAVGHVTAGQSFFAQQRDAVLILVFGVLTAVATYLQACRNAIRRLARLQSEALPAARGALFGLALTALVVLLPLLLAIFVPQHPAP